MTELEYRQAPGMSRSTLWKLRELGTPEKFKHYLDNPEDPSPAMVFGQVLHKLLLQRDAFLDDFAVAPPVDRRTKAGKAEYEKFLEIKGDRIEICRADYETAVEMVKKVLSVPYVPRLLRGDRERPIFWTDEISGIACKARLDVLTEVSGAPVIVDYKTTNDASDVGFARSVIKYGYDFQTAYYSEAVKALTGISPRFVFIAQEKTAPYAVNIIEADALTIQRGYDTFRELLELYKECSESGNWYGYLGPENRINMLALPAWALND